MKFSEKIHAITQPVWDRFYEHPFMRELANGTLPIDKFQMYLLQDTQYTEQFMHLHQVLSEKMPNQKMAAPLLKMVAPGHNENYYRRHIFEAAHITDKLVSETPLAPTTTAYINHMYYQTYFVSPAAGVASLLPCYWLYVTSFKEMADKNPQTSKLYNDFINFCGSDYLRQCSDDMIALFDQLADQTDDNGRKQMQHAFELSADYELMYWDMCYKRELWPHQRYAAFQTINN